MSDIVQVYISYNTQTQIDFPDDLDWDWIASELHNLPRQQLIDNLKLLKRKVDQIAKYLGLSLEQAKSLHSAPIYTSHANVMDGNSLIEAIAQLAKIGRAHV